MDDPVTSGKRLGGEMTERLSVDSYSRHGRTFVASFPTEAALYERVSWQGSTDGRPAGRR